MNCFCLQISTKMSTKICNELWKKKWQKYNVSSVPTRPGIYAIGEKVGTKHTKHKAKYQYVGRAKNIKKRLQQHMSGKKQAIDKRIAEKIKRNKGSDLLIKYVHENRHRSKEADYIDCLAAKAGYRPLLNKRRGDGGGGKARSSQSRSLVGRPSKSVMKAYYLAASLIREALCG